MGTRSRIGIEKKNGTVESIYCHWDGYPSHNGKILYQHYTTRKKVKELMELGDLSSLGPEIGERHDFDLRDDNVCTAYGRDRGEQGTKKMLHNDRDELSKVEDWTEYHYLFTAEGVWLVNQLEGEGWETLTGEIIENN